MPYVNINILVDGSDGYGIEVDTDLPNDSLVHKVLTDTLAAWDKRKLESLEGDEDEGDS